jgi:hypothetical protein
MQATFHLQSSELTDEFFASLKTLTNGHSLTLTLSVHEAVEAFAEDDGLDETERIRRNPALHADIMESLAQANAGNLITLDIAKMLSGALPEESVISHSAEKPA